MGSKSYKIHTFKNFNTFKKLFVDFDFFKKFINFFSPARNPIHFPKRENIPSFVIELCGVSKCSAASSKSAA